MEVRERILKKASDLYMHYGVKNVSMDDIAGELGISKKTIYLYFLRKADMVLEVSKAHFEAEKKIANLLLQSSENAVHELVLSLRQFHQTFQDISPRLIYEIQKYYPRAWQQFDDFKSNFILPVVRNNLLKGIAEGYYRPEIKVEIVALMRVTQMETGFNQTYFPYQQFNQRDVQIEMFHMYMHGLVTDKGQALLETYLEQTPANIFLVSPPPNSSKNP